MALVEVAPMTVAMMCETVTAMVETRASTTAIWPRFEIARIVALAQGVLGNMAVRSALVGETVWSLLAV